MPKDWIMCGLNEHDLYTPIKHGYTAMTIHFPLVGDFMSPGKSSSFSS